MGIHVFRYQPEHRADLEDGLAAYGMNRGGVNLNASSEEILDSPEARYDAVFAVTDGPNNLGMAFVMERPVLRERGRIVGYLLPMENDDRAHAFAHALYDSTREFLSGRGIPRQVVNASGHNARFVRFLQETRFEPFMPFDSSHWQGDGTPSKVPKIENISFEIYASGDPITNDQIEAVWQSAFHSEPLGPSLSPKWIEHLNRFDNMWFMIARDKNQHVVGVSEGGPDNFFSGIAVAQSHKGTGLADALFVRSCNEFMARGQHHLHGITRKTNTASRKLQARHGWEIYDEGMIWATPEND